MTLENTRFTKVKPIFFFVVYNQRFVNFHGQINVKTLDLVQESPPGKETFPSHHSSQCSKFKDCLKLDKKKRLKKKIKSEGILVFLLYKLKTHNEGRIQIINNKEYKLLILIKQ